MKSSAFAPPTDTCCTGSGALPVFAIVACWVAAPPPTLTEPNDSWLVLATAVACPVPVPERATPRLEPSLRAMARVAVRLPCVVGAKLTPTEQESSFGTDAPATQVRAPARTKSRASAPVKPMLLITIASFVEFVTCTLREPLRCPIAWSPKSTLSGWTDGELLPPPRVASTATRIAARTTTAMITPMISPLLEPFPVVKLHATSLGITGPDRAHTPLSPPRTTAV